MKKLMFVLMIGALLLAGCGGGSSGSNPTADAGTGTGTDPGTGADPGTDPGTGADPGTDPGTGASGSALDCLNPQLLAAGTTFQTTTRTVDDEETTVLTSTATVMGDDFFNGQSVTRVSVAVTGDEEFTADHFMRIQDGSAGLTYGAEMTLGDFVTTIVNDPYALERFDLSAGQSYSHSYTSTVTYTDTASMTELMMIKSEIQTETTYVGRETITVEAGTFDTCRFDETMTIQVVGFPVPNTVNGTTWIGVGNGLQIMSMDDEEDIELLSASINGTPVTGN